MKKYLFIDTQIYTSCAAAEREGLSLSVLDKLFSKLEKKEVHLLVPEVIKKEVFKKIDHTFSAIGKLSLLADDILTLKNNSEGSKNPYIAGREGRKKSLQKEGLDIANKHITTKLAEEKCRAHEVLDKIFKSQSCTIIPLTETSLIAGMRRSALLIRPSSVDGKPETNHFIKDIDCIAYECILEELIKISKEKIKIDFIVCTNDSDYCSNAEKLTFHDEILTDLKTRSSRQILYKNPVEMIEKELDVKIKKEDKKEYEGVLKVATHDFVRFGNCYPSNLEGLVAREFINNVRSLDLSVGQYVESLYPNPYEVSRSFAVCSRCGSQFYQPLITTEIPKCSRCKKIEDWDSCAL